MNTIFEQLKKEGFFPKNYSLIKALQFVGHKNYPIERVLLCENEDLILVLKLYLEVNSALEGESEDKKWKRLLNANYDYLLQLAKEVEKRRSITKKALDLIQKEIPLTNKMTKDEIVHYMYAINYYVSEIPSNEKLSGLLRDIASSFLKEDSKIQNEIEIWENFLNYEFEDKSPIKKNLCSHKEIVLVNEVGPKLSSGASEILFKIRCHDCDEILFLTSEYKRNIINISKH